MAIKKVGDTTPRELQPAWSNDPQYGLRKILRFEGFEEDLLTLSEEFRAVGYQSEIEPIESTWCRLRVLVPNAQEGNQAPVDTWERLTELVQDDIRSDPKVIGLIIQATGDTPANAAYLINALYKDSKEKIKAGTNPNYNNPPSQYGAIAQAFFELLSRGADAFLQRRVILRRRRVIPGNQVLQSTVNSVEKFYSTAALVRAFGVPGAIAEKLPIAGDVTPNNTAWGWMERQDTSIITPVFNQAEEVKDWVFAAWSTLLYDYVG